MGSPSASILSAGLGGLGEGNIREVTGMIESFSYRGYEPLNIEMFRPRNSAGKFQDQFTDNTRDTEYIASMCGSFLITLDH